MTSPNVARYIFNRPKSHQLSGMYINQRIAREIQLFSLLFSSACELRCSAVEEFATASHEVLFYIKFRVGTFCVVVRSLIAILACCSIAFLPNSSHLSSASPTLFLVLLSFVFPDMSITRFRSLFPSILCTCPRLAVSFVSSIIEAPSVA